MRQVISLRTTANALFSFLIGAALYGQVPPPSTQPVSAQEKTLQVISFGGFQTCDSNLNAFAQCFAAGSNFTLQFQTQSANTVLVGPTSGGAALMTARLPVVADFTAWKTPYTVCRGTNVASITNSTAETDVLNCSIPGGTLSTNRRVNFKVMGRLRIQDATSTFRIRAYYPTATLIYDSGAIANPGSSGTAGIFNFNGWLAANNNATNQQVFLMQFTWGPRTAASGGVGHLGNFGTSGFTWTGNMYAAPTSDSTATAVLRITVTFAGGSPNTFLGADDNSVTYEPEP